ncbi:hypothetical protein ACWDOP_36100 [Nocardia sp. NPDC003693]
MPENTRPAPELPDGARENWHPDHEEQGEHTGNDRPFLFVHSYPPPVIGGGYPPLDTGARPLPPVVCWYLCTGIEALTPYVPGERLSVRVTIGNWQGGNAETLANVAVWWSHPVGGPTVPDKDKFIGFATVAVAPHGGRATTLTLTTADPIPVAAGPHICLLAKVWHVLDLPAGTLADPVNDRHWAQHNLAAVQANSPVPISFLITNPTEDRTANLVLVRAADSALWPHFTAGDTWRPARAAADLRLTDPVTGESIYGTGALDYAVELDPGEHRELRLDIHAADPLEPGTVAPYEILQCDIDRRPLGGIGIALRGDLR